MNSEFEDFIKKKTVCDADKLDRAIMQGIKRAKSGRLDKTKFFQVLAATAATLLVVTSSDVNGRLYENLHTYFIETSIVNEAGSRALLGYITMIKEEMLWFYY